MSKKRNFWWLFIERLIVPRIFTTGTINFQFALGVDDLDQQMTYCRFRFYMLPEFDYKFQNFVFIAIPLDFDVSSPLTYGTPSSRVEGTPRSGVRGTPVRQRPDLGSARKGLQVDLQSDGVSTQYSLLIASCQEHKMSHSPLTWFCHIFLCSQQQKI